MKKGKIRFYCPMKNKKGFLLGEETLKIIIAVIGIIFLVFLLVSVYFSVTGAQDSKYAEASKILISNEITRINNGGEYNSAGILIPNPAGWYIFSFIEGDKKPNLCTGQNCICLCRNILIDVFDRQIKECDSKGTCFAAPNLEKFDKIKIENSGTFISVQKINNGIIISKK